MGITEGVSKHILGLPAEDPITGIMYLPLTFTTDEEVKTKNLLDAFPGMPVIDKMVADPVKGLQYIKRKAIVMLVASFLWLGCFAGISFGTFYLLMSEKPADEELQVIPVISILCMMSSNALQTHKMEPRTLEKIQQSRRELAALRVFPSSICGGCTREPLRKHEPRGTSMLGIVSQTELTDASPNNSELQVKMDVQKN